MPSDVAESQQGRHPAAGSRNSTGKWPWNAMECHGYAIVSEKLRNDVRNIRCDVEHLCKQGELSGGQSND